MNTVSERTSSSSPLTAGELTTAESQLDSTRERLLATISGLSHAQWHFKPAEDQWSIAETLEHLVLIEQRVGGLVAHMPNAPAAEPDRNNAHIEEIILSQIPIRSGRFQAPAPVLPAQRWPPAQVVDSFVENRGRTLQLLFEAPSLRGHVLPHPVFGSWDGYQWILATAAHTARHTHQMIEVKNCPSFPEH